VIRILLAVVLLTLLAAGGGGFLGLQIFSTMQAQTPATTAPAKPQPEATAHAPPDSGDLTVRELQPMLANLMSPENAWVRVQAAIIFMKKDVPEPDQLAAQITDDLVAYLKTLTAAQIAGASGLQHMREDFNDRAAVRSDGKVREVIIETMVVQ
jgi:flagellar FliL protein